MYVGVIVRVQTHKITPVRYGQCEKIFKSSFNQFCSALNLMKLQKVNQIYKSILNKML